MDRNLGEDSFNVVVDLVQFSGLILDFLLQLLLVKITLGPGGRGFREIVGIMGGVHS